MKPNKTSIAAAALIAACTAPSFAQQQASAAAPAAPSSPAHEAAHAWEAGLAFGWDFDSDRSLWAVSLGRRFGDGWKGVFEFADGRHGDHGAYVTSLKVVKELFRWGHAEFGLGLGGAYVAEAHHNGWGALVAAEVAYPIARQWAAKLEASYLMGVGDLHELRAPVVQAGVVYTF